jgi:hypothetical protein
VPAVGGDRQRPGRNAVAGADGALHRHGAVPDGDPQGKAAPGVRMTTCRIAGPVAEQRGGGEAAQGIGPLQGNVGPGAAGRQSPARGGVAGASGV